MSLRRILAPSLLAVAIVAAGCSSSSSSSSSTGNPKAAALITKTQAAATQAGSVHIVDITKIGSKSETLTGDISSTAAQEVLVVGGQVVLQVRLVSNVIYVETTSASVLQSSLGLTSAQATANVGKWISLASTDTPSASISQSLTISAALTVYYPKSSAAQLLSEQTVAGVKVQPIQSTTTPAKGTTETVTLYVNASNNLPVAADLSAKNSSTSETKKATFTQWGAPVTVTAPTGAVAYASLQTTTTTAGG
jgi:hypothetical protein